MSPIPTLQDVSCAPYQIGRDSAELPRSLIHRPPPSRIQGYSLNTVLHIQYNISRFSQSSIRNDKKRRRHVTLKNSHLSPAATPVAAFMDGSLTARAHQDEYPEMLYNDRKLACIFVPSVLACVAVVCCVYAYCILPYKEWQEAKAEKRRAVSEGKSAPYTSNSTSLL